MIFLFKNKHLAKLIFAVSVMLPAVSYAAPHVKIAESPLVNSGTSDVLPNVMFILDTSGSMDRDFTPDWANSGTPWFFRNAVYNTQFYNPTINYIPAVKYDGATMGNQVSPWTSVKNDVTDTGATKGGTSNLVNSANYFYYVPGEYCTAQNLTTCTISKVPVGANKFPAPLRWCDSTAAASTRTLGVGQNCQSTRVGNFTNQRQPKATYTLTFNLTANSTVSSVKINNIEILRGSVTANSSNNMATAVYDNMCTAANAGVNCLFTDNTKINKAGNVITFSTRIGEPVNTAAPIQVTMTSGTTSSTVVAPNTTDVAGSLVYRNIVSTVTSYPAPGQVAKAPDRTDCAGTTCTYAEEMTNYANWHTYYSTRMQAMKTAASLAFKGIDSRYRVGFIDIYGTNFLAINKFESGAGKQKNIWYQTLYNAVPTSGTPLRSALARVGRMYAGKTLTDPVEYACQQNFALLTTDGYWNTDQNADVRDINNNSIGNLDGGTTPRPMFEGPVANASVASLADTAKYYYDTDIRDQAKFGNCGAKGVCGSATDHLKQNMVTLTLGLGIDGTLVFSDDYKDQLTGDFADIKTGSKNWPKPNADTPSAIDDLWHAAVNSGGTYYSAKNPKLLRDSLVKGLSEIKSIFGAGSAAAASSLAPTAGDNLQFVASYRSVKWTGNIEARTVNLSTLKTNEDAVWCAENIPGETCTLPAVLEANASSGQNAYYCKTPNSNTTDCAASGGQLGVGGTADACYVEVASACNGTMPSRVSATSDSRKILVNQGGALAEFSASSIGSANLLTFQNAFDSLSANPLSQAIDFTTAQKTDPNRVANLVKYLRGQREFENSATNPDVSKRMFRAREATLGDITQAEPAYLGKSPLSYTDAGYSAYKTSSEGRQKTVFVGANDGMLHAFNALNGQEMWAFIPSPVIKNLPKLADRDYAIKHTNFVNGSPFLADICVSGCNASGAVWKTILVSGLNGGGRGYFALDVTDPTNPTLLWEFTSSNDSDLGYTFGKPIVTKLSSGANAGKWVVLVTSGYNNGTYDNDGVTTNSPVGSGQGYFYVLDASNGSVIRKLGTNDGTALSPSGLARMSAYATNAFKNNFATYVYGGDLNGNLWRIDINLGTVVKIATLTSPSGIAQPITTAPELGIVNKKRVIFVGTGKYLESTDLTNTQIQTAYAIEDDNIFTTVTGLRGQLVQQQLQNNGDTRSVSTPLPVDFNTGLGWLIDFPAGERVNIDPLLVNGALLMPTTVPNSSSCLGGGFGWFNYFNYKTGGSNGLPGGIVSEKTNTPPQGLNVLYDGDGNISVSYTGSNDPTPVQLKNKNPGQKGGSRDTVFQKYDDQSYGRRSIWRELIK